MMKKAYLMVICIMTMCIVRSAANANVLEGAVELNGHYYKSYEMGMEWKNAKAFCEALGGHLVTIETEEENGIVVKALSKAHKEYYWIGAYVDDRQMYRWANGKMVTEFYWKPGEPTGHDNIAIIRETGQWAVYPSYYNVPFVCEWENAADAHDAD